MKIYTRSADHNIEPNYKNKFQKKNKILKERIYPVIKL